MYQLFDGVITCDFPLPGIPEVDSTRADIHVRRGSGTPNETGYSWFHDWCENEELILACARREGEDTTSQYLLRFPGLADFEICGDTVTCFPGVECRDDSLRHLLLDQVIPRVWASKGNLVLHASAVQLSDGRVIAFTGESGWGKSTLAGALAERDHRLLGDDCLGLRVTEDGVKVTPSYSSLRLNEDSIAELGMAGRGWGTVSHYSGKRRIEPDDGSALELPLLHTLYILDEPSNVEALLIGTAPGAELITTLIKRSFVLDVHDKHCATRQMREVSAILRVVPKACTLDYPRDYQQLPALCDALSREQSQ